MAFARRMTAGDICKEALALQGLPVPVTISTNSTDVTARQMWALLRTSGRRMCKPVQTHRWQVLTREWIIITEPGKTKYPLPSDFDGFFDLTGWNYTARYPMLTTNEQQWQALKARTLGDMNMTVVYRIAGDMFELHGSPSSANELHISYTSRAWVKLSDSLPDDPHYADAPLGDGDIVMLDPEMMVAALQFAFMTAKGFDTGSISTTLDRLIESAINNDVDAPMLYADAGDEGGPLIGTSGVLWAEGPPGPTGAPGDTGPTGPIGPTGAPGADGSLILLGSHDPSGTDGKDGDFWINTTTNAMFGPKTAGLWSVCLSTTAKWAP